MNDPIEPCVTKIALTDLTPTEIAQTLNLKPFQGKQIFRWLHQRRVFDFDAMTDLSKDLRHTLGEQCHAAQVRLVRVQEASNAAAKKALFELQDGQTVESVLLRDRERITVCVSSQVGCALNCAFCATGQSGYQRNLSPGEIVEQVLHLIADEDLDERTPNVVYMGMGEPFRNYDTVMKSIRLLMMEEGVGVGARKITISTVGDVEGISRFTKEDWQVRLAISLHAANDALRNQLVPLNKKYPLTKLMETVREYAAVTGRHVSFEWVLLKGVNDSPRDAQELADLSRGMDATVNVIPYNAVQDAGFSPPAKGVCEGFCEALVRHGIKAIPRQERGGDIDAACGQLRVRHNAAE